MITSLYFSLLHSHSIPKGANLGARQQLLAERSRLQGVDINVWAIHEARSYTRMFEGYVSQGFHWRPNVAIYRYEDVIYRKAEWLLDIAQWYEWEIDSKHIQNIATAADVRPEQERPDQHIRQVHPGNYRKHLREDAVTIINEALQEYLYLFGYLG